MTASFLMMFLLIASARGALCASTKACASDWVSMPEPAPMELMIFAAAVAPEAAAVLLVETTLDDVELPILVAMGSPISSSYASAQTVKTQAQAT